MLTDEQRLKAMENIQRITLGMSRLLTLYDQLTPEQADELSKEYPFNLSLEDMRSMCWDWYDDVAQPFEEDEQTD